MLYFLPSTKWLYHLNLCNMRPISSLGPTYHSAFLRFRQLGGSWVDQAVSDTAGKSSFVPSRGCSRQSCLYRSIPTAFWFLSLASKPQILRNWLTHLCLFLAALIRFLEGSVRIPVALTVQLALWRPHCLNSLESSYPSAPLPLIYLVFA